MKRIIAWPLLLAFVLLGGCGGMKISRDYDTEYDFSHVKRYDWATRAADEAGPGTNPLNEERIRDAVERALDKRGLRRDAQRPDVRVAWRFREQQKERTSTVSVFGGFGNWGRHGGVSIGVGAPVSTVRTPYTVGTLTIDLLDAKTGRLVWRGSGEAELGGDASPEERASRLQEAVDAILAEFPPAAAGEKGK